MKLTCFMRPLGKYYKKRICVTCTISHFGKHPQGHKTVLLEHIYREGTNELLADHMWIDFPTKFHGLVPNDTIRFKATVYQYTRMTGDDPIDYTFKWIHQVRKYVQDSNAKS